MNRAVEKLVDFLNEVKYSEEMKLVKDLVAGLS